MNKPTAPDLETITAAELEKQVEMQSVREMMIVEAVDGYQLHVPLRDFTSGRIRETAGGKAIAELQVTKPRIRVLATRREKSEPRHYKKIEPLHAYISDTFPDVEMIQLKMLKASERVKPARDDTKRQPGRRSKATEVTAKAPAKKAKSR